MCQNCYRRNMRFQSGIPTDEVLLELVRADPDKFGAMLDSVLDSLNP